MNDVVFDGSMRTAFDTPRSRARHRRLSVGLGLVLGASTLSWLSVSPAESAPVPPTVFVGHIGGVTPITTAGNTAGPLIPAGTGAIVSMAITPDHSRLYAVDVIGSVFPIDLATRQVGPEIDVQILANGIAITPDGSRAYVPNGFGPAVVTPIDLTTDTPGTDINIAAQATAIAITPDGTTAWVPVGFSLIPIDLATDTAGPPIPLLQVASAIAISPDGSTAYLVNFIDNSVTPVDLTTQTLEPSIPVGVQPARIALTPDGSTAYVTNENDDNVTRLDLTTNTAVDVISVGDNPVGIAITPDGRTAYVANRIDDTVTPIDLTTDIPAPPVGVGDNPLSVAVVPGDPADLSVTKVCSPAVAAPGQLVECTMTALNAGPGVAQQVVITDDLPAGAVLAGPPTSSGVCVVAADPEVTCTAAAPLLVGDAASVTYRFTLPPDAVPGTSNLAGATTTSFDYDPANNAAAVVLLPACTIDRRTATRPQVIKGTAGPDVICGSAFQDVIRGRAGNDIVFAGGGQDMVTGGPGDDLLLGGAGRDTLVGNAGEDRAVGGAERDACIVEQATDC